MARKAYPSGSVDQAVEKGVGINYGSSALADVLVDGRRLGELEELLRTPKPFEVRPETKYREAFAAAVASVMLGLVGVELETRRPDGSPRERPDLLLRHGGRELGVEVSRVEPTHRERNALIEIEREVQEAIAAHEALKPRGLMVQFGVSASAVRTLRKGERDKLRDEILDVLRGDCLRLIPLGSPKWTVFGSGTVASQLGMFVTIQDVAAMSSGYGVMVRLEQDAAADALVKPILDALDAKRRDIEEPGYDLSNPLWLVLEVTEQTGVFAESISAVGTGPGRSISPFERVIVHDGRTRCVLERPSST